ncbi:hypothetical protein CK203_050560 [Vitis vinifera]|uniref:DUF659 domain-containing protein n=1 Tax=Vitis vinifera TaxID=29760 RepID=A0A438GFK4_VITVI|nr:hypothetical protein CK203_050560 [Vitis vinifera]
MYSKGLPFNTVNDPYWFPMIDVVANFGPGFKPPSMHELRTWILKEEVNDLSIIMEDHKKAWKQYGCSIMSDGWTDGKSTSGGKGKEKELNLTPIDEDEDLDEMGIHDSGHFPTIDTLDEDDDDLGEEDLS